MYPHNHSRMLDPSQDLVSVNVSLSGEWTQILTRRKHERRSDCVRVGLASGTWWIGGGEGQWEGEEDNWWDTHMEGKETQDI